MERRKDEKSWKDGQMEKDGKKTEKTENRNLNL